MYNWNAKGSDPLSIKPFLNIKQPELQRYNKQTYDADYSVSKRCIEFRHSCEIHTIPSCNHCKRHEDGGNHSEEFHNRVLADINLSLMHLAKLHGVFLEHRDISRKSSCAVYKQTKQMADFIIWWSENAFLQVFAHVF